MHARNHTGLLFPLVLLFAPSQVRAEKGALDHPRRDFCNALLHCGLPVPPSEKCPSRDVLGKPPVEFDTERCRDARLLHARGVLPDAPGFGFKLFRFLGMEYRVVYEVDDSIRISPERLSYLLGDLPLAARLVSHFQEEPYSAEYLDGARKRHFRGRKGKRLEGNARLISGDTAEKRLFYFGYGIAEVAWWRLKGPALLEFSYKPHGMGKKQVFYNMRILVFPGNAFVNGIMNLGIFRNIVYDKIREVLKDITKSARKLEEAGKGDLLKNPVWTLEERRKLESFLKLP